MSSDALRPKGNERFTSWPALVRYWHLYPVLSARALFVARRGWAGIPILTAVVAAELYAGTRDTREKRALDQLCQAHLTLNHFSYPSASTWIDTGTLLCRARKLEAARADATLVTENFRDFERWKRLLASTGKNSEAIQSNVNRGLRSKPPA
jgi:hypothetical protein